MTGSLTCSLPLQMHALLGSRSTTRNSAVRLSLSDPINWYGSCCTIHFLFCPLTWQLIRSDLALYTMPGQHSQPAPTSLGQVCMRFIWYWLVLPSPQLRGKKLHKQKRILMTTSRTTTTITDTKALQRETCVAQAAAVGSRF